MTFYKMKRFCSRSFTPFILLLFLIEDSSLAAIRCSWPLRHFRAAQFRMSSPRLTLKAESLPGDLRDPIDLSEREWILEQEIIILEQELHHTRTIRRQTFFVTSNFRGQFLYLGEEEDLYWELESKKAELEEIRQAIVDLEAY